MNPKGSLGRNGNLSLRIIELGISTFIKIQSYIASFVNLNGRLDNFLSLIFENLLQGKSRTTVRDRERVGKLRIIND